jgi:glutamine amidotransferase
LRAGAPKLALGEGETAAGVGFFQSDDVLLRKRPLPARLAALPEALADGVESPAVLVCAGFLQGPLHSPQTRGFQEEATLPLRFKRWLFALAGKPDGLAPARAALLASLPEHLRRSVRGDNAGEALFFHFLARLRDLGRLDDPDLDAHAAGKALAAAVGEAERALESAGAPHPPLAVVASNGRVLVALRRGHGLSLARLDGLTTCPKHEVGPGMKDHNPLKRSHAVLQARLLLSGEPGAVVEGFVPLPEGGIVAIGRDLSVSQF